MICRHCAGPAGEVVLDLGEQPACDLFPPVTDPGPDPVYPLRMWLCADCGLAQLVEDPTTPAEPRGVEPAALVAQAREAVERVAADDWLPTAGTVTEYGSPHGGSWLPMLTERGLRAGEPADVLLDCFGLMHAADQRAALRERAERLSPNGTLLLQYHSLDSIVHGGQWNALRHGHFGYYSTSALCGMLAGVGLIARTAWRFPLYGGTVLLAAARTGEPDARVAGLLSADNAAGVRNPIVLQGLQQQVTRTATELREFLTEQAGQGLRVFGYGAASRAVALLCRAEVDAGLLPAVADASPAKWGRRMPGTAIPVISPDEMLAREPDTVLLFVPDLLTEVRAALPGVARWAVAEPVPQLV
jgi:hypothetical protein